MRANTTGAKAGGGDGLKNKHSHKNGMNALPQEILKDFSSVKKNELQIWKDKVLEEITKQTEKPRLIPDFASQ